MGANLARAEIAPDTSTMARPQQAKHPGQDFFSSGAPRAAGWTPFS